MGISKRVVEKYLHAMKYTIDTSSLHPDTGVEAIAYVLRDWLKAREDELAPLAERLYETVADRSFYVNRWDRIGHDNIRNCISEHRKYIRLDMLYILHWIDKNYKSNTNDNDDETKEKGITTPDR